MALLPNGINGTQDILSPYLSPIVTLAIGPSGTGYAIHRTILTRYPKLMRSSLTHHYGDRITLPDVDESIGHLLVHYLYTESFDPFKNLNTDEGVISGGAEYQAVIQTYCAAAKYGIDGLEEAARLKLIEYDENIQVAEWLNLLEPVLDAFPEDDKWLHSHIKSKIKDASKVDHKVLSLDGPLLGFLGKNSAIDRVLMASVLEAYVEKTLESLNRKPSSDERVPKESVPEYPEIRDVPPESAQYPEPVEEQSPFGPVSSEKKKKKKKKPANEFAEDLHET